MNKKLDVRSTIEVILVIIGLAAWMVNKEFNLSAGAGTAAFMVTAFSLGIGLGMMGVGFIAQKEKRKKVVGVMLLAFGLFNVLMGIIQLYGYNNGL